MLLEALRDLLRNFLPEGRWEMTIMPTSPLVPWQQLSITRTTNVPRGRCASGVRILIENGLVTVNTLELSAVGNYVNQEAALVADIYDPRLLVGVVRTTCRRLGTEVPSVEAIDEVLDAKN